MDEVRILATGLGFPEGPVAMPDGSVILTEIRNRRCSRVTADEQAQEVARTPLRRVAEAKDQARVICFLASNDADFVTGLTIDVTGGV